MDKIIVTILGAIGIAFAGMVGYWYQANDPPTKILREEVINHAVNPGTTLFLEIVTDRSRNDCKIHVERMIFDGQNTRMALPDEDWEAQPGELGVSRPFREPVFIPHDAAPGNAVYRAIRSYWCNPIQRFFDRPLIVRTDDHAFRIVER